MLSNVTVATIELLLHLDCLNRPSERRKYYCLALNGRTGIRPYCLDVGGKNKLQELQLVQRLVTITTSKTLLPSGVCEKFY